jgi:hypothetical protein
LAQQRFVLAVAQLVFGGHAGRSHLHCALLALRAFLLLAVKAERRDLTCVHLTHVSEAASCAPPV